MKKQALAALLLLFSVLLSYQSYAQQQIPNRVVRVYLERIQFDAVGQDDGLLGGDFDPRIRLQWGGGSSGLPVSNRYFAYDNENNRDFGNNFLLSSNGNICGTAPGNLVIPFTITEAWDDDDVALCNDDQYEPDCGTFISPCSEADDYHMTNVSQSFTVTNTLVSGTVETQTLLFSQGGLVRNYYNVINCGRENNITLNIRLTIRVEVEELPIQEPSVEGTTICTGESVTLNVENGLSQADNTFEWFSDAALTTNVNSGASFTTPVLTTDTTYYVVQETAGGCRSNATPVTVNVVNPASAPVVTNDAANPICAGEAFTLSLDGVALPAGATLEWYADDMRTEFVGTGDGLMINATTTTTYYAFYKFGQCYSGASNGTTVTVDVESEAVTAENVIICEGGLANLIIEKPAAATATEVVIYDATGATELDRATFTGNFANYLANNLPVANFDPATAGTYDLQIALPDGICPAVKSTVTITVLPPSLQDPVPNIPFETCEGNDITLTATAPDGGILVWYSENMGDYSAVYYGSEYTFTPTASGSMYVRQEGGGCSNGDYIEVPYTVNTNPVAPAPTAEPICSGNTAELVGTANTHWYADGATTVEIGTGTLFTTPDNLYYNTTFYAKDIDPVTGCESGVVSVTVIVNETPQPVYINPKTICEGETATLGFGTDSTYWYDDATATNPALAMGVEFTTPALIANTTYYVRNQNGACLGEMTDVTVTVNPIPDAPIANDAEVCTGTSTAIMAEGEDGATFYWFDDATLTHNIQNGATLITPELTATTTYYVAQAVNGCLSEATEVKVIVVSGPCTEGIVNDSIVFGTNFTNGLCTSATWEEFLQCMEDNGCSITLTDYIPDSFTSLPGDADGDGILDEEDGLLLEAFRIERLSQLGLDYTTQPNYFNGVYDISAEVGQPAGTVIVELDNAQIQQFTNGDYTDFFVSILDQPFNVNLASTIPIKARWIQGRNILLGRQEGVNVVDGLDYTFISNLTAGFTHTVETLTPFTGLIGGNLMLNSGTAFYVVNESSTETNNVDHFIWESNDFGYSFEANFFNSSPSTMNRVFFEVVIDNSRDTDNDGVPDYLQPDLLTMKANCILDDLTYTDFYGNVVNIPFSICEVSEPIILDVEATEDTICQGETVTLLGGNTSTVWYEYNLGTMDRIGVGATIDVTPMYTTAYFAQDTAGLCPSAYSKVVVIVKQTPTPYYIAGAEICAGDSATLGYGSDSTYWYADMAGTTILGIGVTYNTGALNATTTYYVQNRDGNCGSEITDVIVIVNPIPDAPTANGAEICNGTSTAITAEGEDGATFYWFDDVDLTHNIQNGATLITPELSANTTYYVAQAVNGCLSEATQVDITIADLLEGPLVDLAEICEGESVTLVATGCTGEVKWYSDMALTNLMFIGSSYTIDGLTEGLYSYYLTCTIDGCSSDVSSTTITVNAAPELPYATYNYTICQGQTVPEGEGLIAACAGGTPAQTGILTLDGTGTPFDISEEDGALYGPITFDATSLPADAKISDVSVSLTMNHTWASDLEFTLNTPSSSYIFLDGSYTFWDDNYGEIGSDGSTPATYVLTDGATDNVGDIYTGSDVHPGTYLPDYPFSALANGNASGIWSIDVEDLAYGDGGSIAASSLTINWIIPASGGAISWWDAPVGGTQLSDQMTFVPTDYETLDPGTYTYFVQCGDASDCGNGRTPVTFTVLPALEAPMVTADDPICENSQASLTADNIIGTLEWYADAELTILLGTGATYTTPNLTDKTTYYAVNNNGVCLSVPTAYEVEVIPAPTVSAFVANPVSQYGEIEVCEGEKIAVYPFLDDPANQVMFLYDLKETDELLFDWIVAAGDGEELEINANSDAVYWLRVYDFNTGCISDPVPLFVNVFNRTPRPEVRGAEVCVGQEATIYADYSNFINDFVPENEATTIVWWDNDLNLLAENDIDFTNPAYNDELVVGPFDAPGTYNFLVGSRVYHENSQFLGYCESELAVVTVVVTDAPETPLNLYDTICAGESTTLNAGNLGGSVMWYADEDLTDLIIISNSLNTGILTTTTQYWYTVNIGGCTSEAGMAEVFVNPLPTLTSVTNNTPICEHSTLELYANTDDATNLTFSWTGPNGFTSTLQNPTIDDVTEVDNQGFYFVTITDATTGCTSMLYSTLAVITKFPDNIIADNDGPTCEDGTIQLNATNVFGAVYEWSGPNGYTSDERNPIITDVTPDMSGTYTVVVTLGECSSEPASTEVVVYPNPVAYAGEDVSTLQGVPIVLNGSGGTTYQWLPLSNDVFTLEPNNIPNPTFYSDSIGIYELYLTVWDDDHGCSDVDTVEITVLPNYNLEVPDLITPNNDNVNDAFVIKYLENIDQPYTLSIYARAGAKVFETTNYGQDWKGTYKDDQLPDGAYWWVLALEDGTVYKGQLTIKR